MDFEIDINYDTIKEEHIFTIIVPRISFDNYDGTPEQALDEIYRGLKKKVLKK